MSHLTETMKYLKKKQLTKNGSAVEFKGKRKLVSLTLCNYNSRSTNIVSIYFKIK